MYESIMRISTIIAIVLIISLLFVSNVFAKETNERAEKSNIGRLYFYEGDRGTWKVTQGSAWGKNTGRLSIQRFKLNYILGQFFVGVNAHYQKTKYLKDWDYINYGNWRIGGQIGIFF